jgi:hypothetical protein
LTITFATPAPAFFALEKPSSRNMNPACMNITSTAAITTHIALMLAGDVSRIGVS